MTNPPEKIVQMHPASSDIVLSSRVRLARNLDGYPFPGWLQKSDRETVLGVLTPAVSGLPEMKDPMMIQSMEKLPRLDREVLMEQHLISREHASRNVGSGLAISGSHHLSIMMNEEDHLRIQSFQKGFSLFEAWKVADQIDSELESSLKFAFSPTLGFLTSCPTNLGTGMRASAMLHLPGLVLSENINGVIKSANQIRLAVRGLHGEGTEAMGNLFQISNQTTLGDSEIQILEHIQKVVNALIAHEHNARIKFLQDKERLLKDQLGRAYGILTRAHSISSKEALNLLSMLRLGIDLGLLSRKDQKAVDTLFTESQPGHLQQIAGRKLSAEERDGFRADLLREKLKSLEQPL